MNKFRNASFYILLIILAVIGLYFLLQAGKPLEVTKVFKAPQQTEMNGIGQFKSTLHHNVTHPLAILILQIITIILCSRLFAFFAKKIGQPTVIGEIVAGILLGPSFVGYYFPEVSGFLFPKASLSNLQFFSQIGLILFMFIIGMELDLSVIRKRAHEAVMISHASIIFPFLLGVTLAYTMYLNYAPANVNFLSFALFIGIAMSITAFPVLARIVQERQLTKTKIGAIAITCAAVDDVTAWCILAAVIAVVKAGSIVSSIYTVLSAALFVILMLKLVRPFLKRIGDIYSNHNTLSKPVVAIFFVTLLSSSFLSEIIGIHALFGAFLAGVIMPQNLHFRNIFIEKVEDLSVVLLLPLFFVLTGLRTQIGLLNDVDQWKTCAIIIAVAITGKFLGSTLAAKFTRLNWKDSLTIGALMNTRGLMELVVLNIGFDLGLLSPQVFAMMVIMALFTTFMTGPALDFINYLFPEKVEQVESNAMYKKFKILLSFGNVERGKNMLKIAYALVRKNQESAHVVAIHMVTSNEVHQYNLADVEKSVFRPIKKEASKFNLNIEPIFKPTLDFKKEIIETSNEDNFDLLIIGMGQSIYQGSFLGRLLGVTSKIMNPEKLFKTITGKEKILETNGFDERTNDILKASKPTVAVFADKGLKKIEKVMFLLKYEEDEFVLPYLQKLILNNETHITVIDYAALSKNNTQIKYSIKALEESAPNLIRVLNQNALEKEQLKTYDLLFMGTASWKGFVETEAEWLEHVPSLLIFRK